MQASVGSAGRSVEQSLLESIGELNAELAPGEIGPIGAVIGPTRVDPRLDLASAKALFFASRSLLVSPDPARLRDDVGALATKFAQILVN